MIKNHHMNREQMLIYKPYVDLIYKFNYVTTGDPNNFQAFTYELNERDLYNITEQIEVGNRQVKLNYYQPPFDATGEIKAKGGAKTKEIIDTSAKYLTDAKLRFEQTKDPQTWEIIMKKVSQPR